MQTPKIPTDVAQRQKCGIFIGVTEMNVDENGAILGKYQRRGDASKVIAKLAYQPESRW